MWKRTRNVVAVVLVGVLMCMASPSAAQAEPTKNSEPPPVSISDLRALGALEYAVRNFKSKKVLQAASDSNGAQVFQNNDVGAALQRWTLVVDGPYRTFWNAAPNGLNMGIDGASTAPGAVAIVAFGSVHFNQDFQVIAQTTTEFNLKNRHSGLCLGIDGASTAPGALAMQFTCSPTAPNQNWQLVVT